MGGKLVSSTEGKKVAPPSVLEDRLRPFLIVFPGVMAFRRLAPPLSKVAKTFGEYEHGVKFNSSAPNPIPLPDEVDTRENEIVAPEFTNRNPVNLERLAIARKDLGWKTSWPKRDYWYRLRLEKTQKHVTGYVEHYSGDIVVSASTREWAIKKHLYKTTGVAACENVGRVLAQRCLEAGINFVADNVVITWEKRGEGLKRFKKMMTEGGVELKELERIYDKYGNKKWPKEESQKPAVPTLEDSRSHT
ncbi:large ribosomal subunit protein uL18m [Erythrolamprus reginae]|uniref:large ribosomal subunit protein uL18m n=1 Tax=Erythrolamprus reginae TaxID=121349 RepID=UPI00396CBC06